MVGVGANNSVGFFDNVVVQVLPPETTFQATEDFSDGVADLFAGDQVGAWQIVGGRYQGAPAGGTDKAISILDPGTTLGFDPGEFRMEPSSVLKLEATVNTAVSGGVVFDYVNADRFKFAAVRADTGQVIVGHYTADDGWVYDAVADRAIGAGQDHTLEIFLKGSTVSAPPSATRLT